MPAFPKSTGRQVLVMASLSLALSGAAAAQTIRDAPDPDATLRRYFEVETARVAGALPRYETAEQWRNSRPELLRQLREMLGLDPWPPRTELKPVVTGALERDGVRVERLHFQSSPGLYVTANLYRPSELKGRAPAVLYVCGHGAVKRNGVSYGNKVHYQHHGVWFARNGYVCLAIDSLQLGEIEGVHHGSYRYDRWWWWNRGYTPAGVEAWNCVRALDYLQSRADVDPERLGVTGRSGGGAYSWWIAALDERIRAAVPVAGVTDLENHVVDGCVEGHCDCMYFGNAYRWDYPLLAAMVAPRPLLISNTDRDSIFPLDGVVRTHRYARSIYRLLKADQELALHITAGPHKDTQELRVHAFRWLNRHLRGDESLLEVAARPLFEPDELRVLQSIPDDQRNTVIDQQFVPKPELGSPPRDAEQWDLQRREWMTQLRAKTFAGWPQASDSRPPAVRTAWRKSTWDQASEDQPFLSLAWVETQEPMRIPVLTISTVPNAQRVSVMVADEDLWANAVRNVAAIWPEPFEARESEERPTVAAARRSLRLLMPGEAVVLIAPRGVGPTRWEGDRKRQVQIRRRFYLLGQTRDGMRVWDVVQCFRATQARYPGVQEWEIQARGSMAGVALFASLFVEPDTLRLLGLSPNLSSITLLNVERILRGQHALAMAATASQVELPRGDLDAWSHASEILSRLDRRLTATAR